MLNHYTLNVSAALEVRLISVNCLIPFMSTYLNSRDEHPTAPCTLLRALSQAHNPSASPMDTALAVLYNVESIVGYLGLLPLALNVDSCSPCPPYFFTTFYVVPEFRPTGALTLLRHALDLQRDIIVSNYTDRAAMIYNALGFRELGKVSYLVLERPVGTRSRDTGKPHAIANSVPFDAPLTNDSVSWLECQESLGISAPRRVTLIDHFPKSIDTQCTTEGSLFLRDSTILNWMLCRPWVRVGAATAPAYEFTDAVDFFHQAALEIQDYSGGLAFCYLYIVANRHNRVLKLIRCIASDDTGYRSLLHVCFTYAAAAGVDEIHMEGCMSRYVLARRAKNITATFRNRVFLHKRPEMGRSVLPGDTSDLGLSCWDGDVAFT